MGNPSTTCSASSKYLFLLFRYIMITKKTAAIRTKNSIMPLANPMVIPLLLLFPPLFMEGILYPKSSPFDGMRMDGATLGKCVDFE